MHMAAAQLICARRRPTMHPPHIWRVVVPAASAVRIRSIRTVSICHASVLGLRGIQLLSFLQGSEEHTATHCDPQHSGFPPLRENGQELYHLEGSKPMCRTCHVAECHDSIESNTHTASPTQNLGSKIPGSSDKAVFIARKTHLQEGGGALLPVDLASAVHNALVAAALSLRHEARLDHIQRRRGKAGHSSSQSANDRCLCRLQLSPPTVACFQAGLHSTTAHVDARALQPRKHIRMRRQGVCYGKICTVKRASKLGRRQMSSPA